MTLQQAYQAAYTRLKPTRAESLAFDLSCLFEQAFGVSRYRLPLVGERPAPPQQAEQFQSLCSRYARGEPLQYLLGEWEFFGLPFRVGPGVLIPRPDTEILVEAALALLEGRAAPCVADLCAGSGCVGIAIASRRPDAQVWAIELSDAAFGYLRDNIALNRVGVTAIQADALQPPALPPLDLVVSNPPYIAQAELDTLEIQVQHEPRMALAGGADGLDFYRALPPVYDPLLKPGGALAFEVGYNQSQAVAALLERAGYREIAVHRDLAGIERVVCGRK